ncbi:NAD(P)/FAD-dependent oxidoreductase [Parafrankia sp. EUN1f]|uniref:flavin-containing monooxygenase n=1 Tax=Parafrankia sp. EUN1f TaxID=102897 RepID=UPI0001C47403|nr:NAD(P)/FAD-dependent oxidoreductase [Parafrankia sp. EUN1f]EFC86794.1 FAD-dependent pyridine nucleotide-disulphide oxidoreductase [Parafrankia sp. EUN1f]
MTQAIAGRSSVASSAPDEAVAAWLPPFAAAVAARDVGAIVDLFAEDSWWRDLLAMSWNLRTLRGPQQMRTFLEDRTAASGIGEFRVWDEADPAFVDNGDGSGFVQVFLSFRTSVGRGLAVARLIEVEGRWKAHSLMTSLQELDGRELPVGLNRPKGERIPTRNWATRRREALEFKQDPDVVVLGAGHAGLAATAYLQLMGVSTLTLERNASVGDGWRNRYDSLVLHDPVWLDEMPFLPYPATWPQYLPKDLIADWFEVYVKALDLNVWTSTKLTSATYSPTDERWTVEVRRGDGTTHTLRPRHFVMATGLMTEPNIPTFEGRDDFTGTVIHTTEYVNGRDWEGKKAVVVGTANSGHDVAKDLCDHGAQVTMLQRSATYVMTQDGSKPFVDGPAYTATGPGVHIADLMQLAMPFGQMLAIAPELTRKMGELDRKTIEGLEGAGFRVEDGSVSGGLVGLGLGVGGGYLIDVGSAQYIIDGKIAVAHGEIRRFVPEGLELADGTVLEADIVVLATGFKNMRETVRKVLGDRVADACGPLWGLDEGHELNGMWRPTGHPNLWFSAGSFPYSRIYNRFLALQIAADLDGLR